LVSVFNGELKTQLLNQAREKGVIISL